MTSHFPFRMNTATHPNTETLAIVSLVCSATSVAAGPIGFIPGIICGHIARSRMRRNPSLSGSGFATAGLIIGYAALVIYAGIFFFVLSSVFGPSPLFAPQ